MKLRLWVKIFLTTLLSILVILLSIGVMARWLKKPGAEDNAIKSADGFTLLLVAPQNLSVEHQALDYQALLPLIKASDLSVHALVSDNNSQVHQKQLATVGFKDVLSSEHKLLTYQSEGLKVAALLVEQVDDTTKTTVEKLSLENDLVITWLISQQTMPEPFYDLIAWGADIVVGNQATMQSIELVEFQNEAKLIIHSLGNLLSDQAAIVEVPISFQMDHWSFSDVMIHPVTTILEKEQKHVLLTAPYLKENPNNYQKAQVDEIKAKDQLIRTLLSTKKE